ncbi:hypothetical protein PHYSODRAFT_323218 [Phytophthora sojae]|uniref:Uncharacterized protein n=1 Tax=Phytophthora sojae (strain P6497) TaxID=1094619 RepID=G4YJE2_PHYSP|nr:hypothetical protein PHYSODRAFT_323218 [Phytophthora sojae]EGZ29739.1 hypothetical protein PHYSODRAFT_323218 [Phytophthora sojae]|eukprot:XP_009517014.1 hypothetical protein PHYSODRAFT_323218 [Phytophthora sojae]
MRCTGIPYRGSKGSGGASVVLNCVPSSSSSSSNSSSGGDAWEAPTEFQSRNVSWWKAVEVVLAPHTAEAQTVTVSANVTVVDSVSPRAVVVEVWRVVRCIPGSRSLVSSAVMLQPLVVESREVEPAPLSLSALNVLMESLDQSAVWPEYWSVDVEVHGRDLGASVSGLALDGNSSEVEERGGRVERVSGLPSGPVASFAGVFRGSIVLVFGHMRTAALKAEIVDALRPGSCARYCWRTDRCAGPAGEFAVAQRELVEVVLAPRTAKSQIRLSLSGLNVVVELVDNK